MEQVGGIFTPVKYSNDNASKYTGVQIKHFSREADHGAIIEFLVNQGMPENKKENVRIMNNGTVLIKELDNAESLKLIASIHNKTHMRRQLFCSGIVPMSPEKNDSTCPENSAPSVNVTVSSPIAPNDIISSEVPSANASTSQELHIRTSSSQDENPTSETFVPASTLRFNLNFPSREVIVRRHSISLCNRTPPKNSLAADILGSRKKVRRFSRKGRGIKEAGPKKQS